HDKRRHKESNGQGDPANAVHGTISSSDQVQCFQLVSPTVASLLLDGEKCKGIDSPLGRILPNGKEGAAASARHPPSQVPARRDTPAPRRVKFRTLGTHVGRSSPAGQVAKCHVWPSDRFSPENTRL